MPILNLKRLLKKKTVPEKTEERGLKLEKEKKEVKLSEKALEKKERKVYPLAHQILIKPIITEKASNLGPLSQYVFEVAPTANKVAVKKTVEALYGVKPLRVNIIKMLGKKVRYGRVRGKMKNWKKAVVILRPGDKIDVYGGV